MESYLRGDKGPLFSLCDEFTAFQDWPYPLAYPDLFERYGREAKFILTIRKSPEIWLKSLKKHCLRAHPNTTSQKLAYGHSYPHGYEEKFLDIYRNHNQTVLEFFDLNDASDRLLVLCWENGDNWTELCKFLNMPIPKEEFPHILRTKEDDICGKRNYRANVIRVKEQLRFLQRPYADHISTPHSTTALLLPRKIRNFMWQHGWI